jgi:AcrR family transcriptional regulator
MPRIVDHAERRRAVAEVAARLVAEGGIDSVTVRDVAAKAGTSTAIVSHYFAGKRELLALTYAQAAGHARARVEAVLARDPADVAGVCEAILPLDDDRRRDWQVWFAFWGPAVADAELAAEQRRRVAGTLETLTATLRRAHEALGTAAAREEARRLLTIVTGIATQAVFDPGQWTPARQRRMLKQELARVAGAR